MADDGDSDFVFYHYKPLLVAAIIFVTLFGLLSSLHLIRMMKIRTWPFTPFVLGGFVRSVAVHMLVLYLGSIFIPVRSVFRVVEYVNGQDGYLMSHECCLYVFDGMLMVFVMAVFVWRYPGEINALVE